MDSEICRICGGSTELLDVVDFNKSCLEEKGTFFQLSGRPVYYRICETCEHVHCPEICAWSEGEFSELIYNDEYVIVDPDFQEVRPSGNASLMEGTFGKSKGSIRHLDYGGGTGLLSEKLKELGWDSTTYDPFGPFKTDLLGLGKYDLITAFEVFEHVPDPNQLMTNLRLLADNRSLIFFSTLISDGQLGKNKRINWWYCSPRNGHINLFSKKSLFVLGEKNGLKLGSFNQNLHVFYDEAPDWARHLFNAS